MFLYANISNSHILVRKAGSVHNLKTNKKKSIFEAMNINLKISHANSKKNVDFSCNFNNEKLT